jgi:hypothetical protein
MKNGRNDEILALIDRLSSEIKLAHNYSLAQTAHLLEMATLDLVTIVHAISDEELRLFTRVVEDTVTPPDASVRPN